MDTGISGTLNRSNAKWPFLERDETKSRHCHGSRMEIARYDEPYSIRVAMTNQRVLAFVHTDDREMIFCSPRFDVFPIVAFVFSFR